MAPPFKVDAKLLGGEEVREEIERLGKEYPEAVNGALYRMGFLVQANAVGRTPVEFGVLRSSAYTSPPTERLGEVSVEVGYGTKYAIFQHEDASLRHPRGGEAGFLRKAVEDTVSLEKIAAWTRANVERQQGTPAVGPRPAAGAEGPLRSEKAYQRRERRQKRREGK